MGFEKRVLEVAESCGIEDAYFYEGTMFFSPDNCGQSAIITFTNVYQNMFRGEPKFSNVGDEVAVDFVLA